MRPSYRSDSSNFFLLYLVVVRYQKYLFNLKEIDSNGVLLKN